eukprot:4988090-Amphidinium_carterae.2
MVHVRSPTSATCLNNVSAYVESPRGLYSCHPLTEQGWTSENQLTEKQSKLEDPHTPLLSNTINVEVMRVPL